MGENVGDRFAVEVGTQADAHQQYDAAGVRIEAKLGLILRVNQQIGFQHQAEYDERPASRDATVMEVDVHRFQVVLEVFEPDVEALDFEKTCFENVVRVGKTDDCADIADYGFESFPAHLAVLPVQTENCGNPRWLERTGGREPATCGRRSHRARNVSRPGDGPVRYWP